MSSDDHWWPSELLRKMKRIAEIKVPYEEIGNPIKVEYCQAMTYGNVDDIFAILTDKARRIVFHVSRNKNPDDKEFRMKMMCKGQEDYFLVGVEDDKNQQFVMTSEDGSCKIVATL